MDAGMLRFEVARPNLHGFEMHLARMYRDVDHFQPGVVAVDPISAFRGPTSEVYAVLLRMVDMLKSRGITALFTSLRSGALEDGSDEGLSSLMDTWVKLMSVESNGERNRVLYIIKSRGSYHSNQVREYRMTDAGIELINAYIGVDRVLTGTARIAQVAREHSASLRRVQETARSRRALVRRRDALERQIADLRAALEGEEEEVQMLIAEDEASDITSGNDRRVVADRGGHVA
jgi:circadian clock protein KaiC